MNPAAFREIRDIAWALGKQHKLLPSMHLAMVTQNMSTHHAFVGAEIGPCKWCGVEHGASAAHFLQCTALADLRDPFEEQIDQTFMSGAAKQMSKLDTPLTKQEVLQNILNVQPVEDQGPAEPHASQSVGDSSTASQPVAKKSRITCPRCQGDYALTKKGTPTQHTKKCNERVAAIEAANIAARAAAEAAASASQGSAEAGVASQDPSSPWRGTAYWKLQFRKNASTIATYTGMFSAFTLAFFAGFIPHELSRKRVVRKVRELLLQRAHYAWWAQRERIAADSATSTMTRSYIRRRKPPQTPTTTRENVGASRQTPTRTHRRNTRLKNEGKPCRRSKQWRQL